VDLERTGLSSQLGDVTMRLIHLRPDQLDELVTKDADIAALGRFAVTLDPKDISTFRTPSLRNVAVTAPYMHDGSVATLVEAVDREIYYRGVERPIALNPAERQDLVAFLGSLTGVPPEQGPSSP
jgi:cytochrome c peroxidase